MWDGTISAADFKSESIAFLQYWKSVDTSGYQWLWQDCAQSTAGGYLSLENVPKICTDKCEKEEQKSPNKDDYFVDSSDAATLVTDSYPDQWNSLYSYHVIYNESYRVPILFFQGHYLDGRLISWEDFQSNLTAHSLLLVEQSRWTFLTQEEHPFLHRPWLSLHPCGTSSIMAMVLSDQVNRSMQEGLDGTEVQHCPDLPSHIESESLRMCTGEGSNFYTTDTTVTLPSLVPSWVGGQYLLTWLSFVGSVARLDLSLNLFKFYQHKAPMVTTI